MPTDRPGNVWRWLALALAFAFVTLVIIIGKALGL